MYKIADSNSLKKATIHKSLLYAVLTHLFSFAICVLEYETNRKPLV